MSVSISLNSRAGTAARSAALAAVAAAPPTTTADGPRGLVTDLLPVDHPLAIARYQSPLRYPGAKSQLAPTIGRLLESATTSREVRRVELLVEPFAGGASVSLRMVGAGIVDRVLLADADPLVAAFWQAAAADTSDLIDRITNEYTRYIAKGGQTAVGRWDHWRAWTPPRGRAPMDVRLDAAVKALFLNRTSFSGIIHGRAGPIGGRHQRSTYTIGARFNLEALVARIEFVGQLYDSGRLLDVWCKDWRVTLDDVASAYKALLPSRVVAYLDPPYLEKSEKLYQRSFDPHGGYAAAPVDDLHWGDPLMHLRLAEYLRREARFRWVLSYDAHPSLTDDPAMYGTDRMTPDDDAKQLDGVKEWRISKRLVSMRYSATASRRPIKDELLLTTLPPSTIPTDDEFRPLG